MSAEHPGPDMAPPPAPSEARGITRRGLLKGAAAAAAGSALVGALPLIAAGEEASPPPPEVDTLEARQATAEIVLDAANYYGGNFIDGAGRVHSNAYKGSRDLWRVQYDYIAFEKDPKLGVVPVPLLNEMSDMGLDAQLDAQYQIPPAAKPIATFRDTEQGFLESAKKFGVDEGLLQKIAGTRELLDLGAITGKPKDYGPFLAIRFANGVLKVSEDGSVVPVQIADIAKAVGRDIPASRTMLPEFAVLAVPGAAGGPSPELTTEPKPVFGNLERDRVAIEWNGNTKLLPTDWRAWRKVVSRAKKYEPNGKPVNVRVLDSVNDLTPRHRLSVPDLGVMINGKEEISGNNPFGAYDVVDDGGSITLILGLDQSALAKLKQPLNNGDNFVEWRRNKMNKIITSIVANSIEFNTANTAMWPSSGNSEEMRSLYEPTPVLELQAKV